MRFRGTADFKPANLDRVTDKVVGTITAAVQEGCWAVHGESVAIVPVRTGDLQQSIGNEVILQGSTVKGYIWAGDSKVDYSAYVEMGTGIRGAASARPGPGPYSPTWPGQTSQPYLRPALDNSRDKILGAFTKRGFKV